MTTLLLIILVAVLALGGLCVIIASVTRCRKCGGWHDSPDEDRKCAEDYGMD